MGVHTARLYVMCKHSQTYSITVYTVGDLPTVNTFMSLLI